MQETITIIGENKWKFLGVKFLLSEVKPKMYGECIYGGAGGAGWWLKVFRGAQSC